MEIPCSNRLPSPTYSDLSGGYLAVLSAQLLYICYKCRFASAATRQLINPSGCRLQHSCGDGVRLLLRGQSRAAGAATLDILTQYVNTIKALKEVDPRGMLLNAVGEPIKAYLRGRPDTIRCIVHSLTDDNADDSLFGELTQPADEEVGHCSYHRAFPKGWKG